MRNKRNTMIFFISILMLLSAVPPRSGSEAPAAAATPDAVLAMLKASNEQYVEGKTLIPHVSQARREETASKGQHPLVTFLSCSDSRVPVEMIFDQGIGDVFVVRDAGNVCGSNEIGSIEYGVEHLGTPLLVVMGHSKCGAVTAAVTRAAVGGSIPVIIEHILPAVAATRQAYPTVDISGLVPEVIKANVWQSIADLYQRSAIVRELVEQKKLKVVGAIYDIESGRVQWLGTHPKEKELLGETDSSKESNDSSKGKKDEAHQGRKVKLLPEGKRK